MIGIRAQLDSHWMLLLAADRIDAIEHNPRRVAGIALVLDGLIVGGRAPKRRR